MSVPSTSVVHVYYRIGVIQEKIPNVNLTDLRTALIELISDPAQVERKKYLDQILLGDVAPDYLPDQYIEALSSLPPKLEVQEDITCKTGFMKEWWLSKTPVAMIICLLRTATDVKAREAQRKQDEEIRSTFDVGKATTAITVAADVKQPQVDAWLREWERKHA
jgi:hypothetical protein